MPELLHERPRSIYERFDRKDGDQTNTHYCPGCGHGNAHKFIAEAVDDLGIRDRVIFVNPVGCSVFAYYYLDFGHIQSAHGRAPAVATGARRARPDSIVISYQGDGDLGAIGGNEILQAASRGENLTVVFINNAIYGMTGGQMAPTTLLGQVTTTSPYGRLADQEGPPLRVCELLNSLEAPVYLERVALGDAKHLMATRKAIRKAIQNQVDGKGFSLVEVLSPCPTGWKMPTREAARWMLEHMTKTFPLGVVRDKDVEPSRGMTGRRKDVLPENIPQLLKLVPREARPAGLTAGAGPGGAIEPRFANPRIKVAGFGGQGVLFLGALIAEAGMAAGRAVSWLPSYGPEMRGGTAHCHVILSETEVDSPLVTSSTVLFAFNQPSLEKFAGEIAKGGLIIHDSTLAPNPPALPGVEVIGVPAATIGDRIGSTRMGNIAALGAYVARTRVLDPSVIEEVLKQNLKKPELLALNLKALEEGIRFVNEGGRP